MRHVLMNSKFEVVNVIIWEGAEFVPPRNHYVMKDDVGQLGDWYDKESGIFITPEKKKRLCIEGKCAHEELDAAIEKRLAEAEFGPFHPDFVQEEVV